MRLCGSRQKALHLRSTQRENTSDQFGYIPDTSKHRAIVSLWSTDSSVGSSEGRERASDASDTHCKGLDCGFWRIQHVNCGYHSSCLVYHSIREAKALFRVATRQRRNDKIVSIAEQMYTYYHYQRIMSMTRSRPQTRYLPTSPLPEDTKKRQKNSRHTLQQKSERCVI